MKNQFVLRLTTCMVALSTLFLLGCNKKNDGPDNEDPFRLEANLVMGSKLFANTLGSRTSEHAFEILEVIRKSDVLEVKVKGGSDAESFQFIWDGRIQESFPMGIQLILLYDNTAGDFDSDKELSVTVNLQKIIGERNNVEDYHFHVINGSKIQTATLNPDGTTTSENK
ncbi:hypothetical protein ACFQRK_03770 [Parapedobacter sp. GCM10030251]|uniref:hypothetical protein n=1 Tax=Parapedobacter sp. GCM10030251 TaxID=3273419 RepID=UPI003607DB71